MGDRHPSRGLIRIRGHFNTVQEKLVYSHVPSPPPDPDNSGPKTLRPRTEGLLPRGWLEEEHPTPVQIGQADRADPLSVHGEHVQPLPKSRGSLVGDRIRGPYKEGQELPMEEHPACV